MSAASVKRSILVTGGSGFIGRNLAEQLADDYAVLAPSRAEFDLLNDDQVRDYMRANRVDVVVHSATKPGHRNAPDPTGLVAANLRMFFNLMRNRDCFGRMICMGSGAVYDMAHYEPKMPEAYFGAHMPADEHGFSKYVQAHAIAQEQGIVELRVFGVFGKYEDYAIRFISNAICKALLDLPITLRQDRLFDYVSIDDLVRVTRAFIDREPALKAYNVTPDRAVGLLEIAELVRDVSGTDVPIVVGAPGRGVEYSGDNARLRAELPGFAFTPLESAVRDLHSWYAANIDSIDRSALLVDK
jgi:GDP-L-fucose synthase